MICPKCNTEFEPRPWQLVLRKGGGPDKRCRACVRRQSNERNRNDPDFRQKKRDYYRRRPEVFSEYRKRRREQDPAFRQIEWARRQLGNAVRAGRLTRLPCEVCGNPKTDGHHHDYSKPFEVRWLCRRCHFALEHRKEPVNACA